MVLAFDEGPDAGMGHRRRCAALAIALEARGSRAIAVPLAGDRPTRVDAPTIVVDSYRTRADDRALYRAEVVVALDDLTRDLDVALVVDPAPGASSVPHQRAGRVLAGGAYAIVDPAVAKNSPVTRRVAPRSVLVATGASDASGAGARMAAAVACAHPALRVRLVIGPWGDSRIPDGVEAVHAPDGLVTEIVGSDLVVTAGGVTLLESVALGVPTVAVVLAANQRRNVDGVVGAGAALAADLDRVSDVVTRLVADPVLRDDLATAGPALIDGHGANRVADAIVTRRVRAAA